jgi:aromatic ring-cleaving dioxygenase
MSDATAGSPVVHGYHAHVHYDAASLQVAWRLREALAARFAVELCRFGGEPVGRHPSIQMHRRGYSQSLLPKS